MPEIPVYWKFTSKDTIQGFVSPDGELIAGDSPAMLKLDANGNPIGIVNLATSGGNNTIMALGDSITAIGYTAATATAIEFTTDLSYLSNLCNLSNGRLTWGGVSAFGGISSATVITGYLPAVLTAKPKYCVVHCGTNDLGTLTQAQTRANLLYIYQTLLANGIVPIATSMLPKSTQTGANTSNLQQITLWIAKTARNLGIPYCNWASTLFSADGSGTWASIGSANTSYTTDGTHQLPASSMIMATALWNTIQNYCSPEQNYCVQVQNNSNLTPFYPTTTNALHITNTAGLAFGYGAFTGTASVSAMSASEGVGNWQNFTATSASHFITGAANTAIVKGNKYLLAFKYKTSGVVANNGSFKVMVGDGSNNADIAGFLSCNQDVALGMFYREFIMPNIAGTVVRIQVTINGIGATLSLGQVTLIDLTANGLD